MLRTPGPAAPRPGVRDGRRPSADEFAAPALRKGLVARTPLVNRLRASGATPVVAIAAPPGYGKTTLLAQWAHRDHRRFVWLAIDRRDRDVEAFLRRLGLALRAAGVTIERDGAPTAHRSIGELLVAQLARSLNAAAEPTVVVLDDAHRLEDPAAFQALAALIDLVPSGSQLAFAGRSLSALPLARLRAHGRMTEFGPDELRLSDREARALVNASGIELAHAEVIRMNARTEGWPAGLHLAVLSARTAPAEPAGKAAGVRPSAELVEYFTGDLLPSLSPEERTMLPRIALPERICGQLCDAMLERSGFGAALEAMERANLFLIPLDRRREWYRFHSVVRELLVEELERRETTATIARLNRRAAEWFSSHGDFEAAIDHFEAAGELERIIELVGVAAQALWNKGYHGTLEHWLRRLDQPVLLDRHPEIAFYGAVMAALTGRVEDAHRLADALERSSYDGAMPDASSSPEGWRALARAVLCRRGLGQMSIDAEHALAALAPASVLRPVALLALGVARTLAGDAGGGDSALAAAADAAEAVELAGVMSVALAERSLIARRREAWTTAGALATRARDLAVDAGIGGQVHAALAWAASAREALRQGEWTRARAELELGAELGPRLTPVLSWYAAQVKLELATAYLGLADIDAAARQLDGATEILTANPGLGSLVDGAAVVRRELDRLRRDRPERMAGLTAAELRLLLLLPSHLSFRAIAERLNLSRNTIKTQSISVYRKLGVSSRREAIVRAAELGMTLVDRLPPAEPPGAVRAADGWG